MTTITIPDLATYGDSTLVEGRQIARTPVQVQRGEALRLLVVAGPTLVGRRITLRWARESTAPNAVGQLVTSAGSYELIVAGSTTKYLSGRYVWELWSEDPDTGDQTPIMLGSALFVAEALGQVAVDPADAFVTLSQVETLIADAIANFT